jgi:hypothetical protein
VVPTAERTFVSSPIGWSSIFAATVVTLGVWLALHLFGIGVGLTALDPRDAGSLKGVGIGVGIWSVIAPLIALFIGGLVVGRVAPTINTLNAAIHGAVVWALSLLLTLLLLVNAFGMIARGAASAGSAVAGAVSSAAGAATSGEMLQSLGIDENTVFAPVNRRLQERGMPPVAPDRARAAAQEMLRTRVQQGELSREQAVDIVARQTELSRADAEQVATELQERVNQAGQRGQEVAQQAKETALTAAEGAGKVIMAMVALMVLGLAATIGGAILSVRRERREHVVLPRATTRAPIVTS